MSTPVIRPIRKTAFMMYRHCEKQFDFFYKDPNYFSYGKTDNASEAQIKGTRFHQAADEMFKQLDIIRLYEIRDDDVYLYLRSLLPSGDDLSDWYDFLAEVEAARFLLGRHTYKEKVKDVFPPKHIELEVKLDDIIPRTGHVDRIDYLPGTNSLCVVEYKTGMYYDFEKANVLTGLRAETGWYAAILNSNKQLELPITHWACINPTRRTYHAEKFSPLSLRAVESNYQDLVKQIKAGGPWPRNFSPLCMWCNYQTECMYTLPPEETLAGFLEQTYGS